jgi:hypothetical protein
MKIQPEGWWVPITMGAVRLRETDRDFIAEDATARLTPIITGTLIEAVAEKYR